MEPIFVAVIVISLGLMLAHEFRKRFVSYRDAAQERLEIIGELRESVRIAMKRVFEQDREISSLTKELEHRNAQVASLQEANRKAALTITDLETEIDAKDEKIKSLLELPEKWHPSTATERVLRYEATQMERDPNKAPAFEFADCAGVPSGV